MKMRNCSSIITFQNGGGNQSHLFANSPHFSYVSVQAPIFLLGLEDALVPGRSGADPVASPGKGGAPRPWQRRGRAGCPFGTGT